MHGIIVAAAILAHTLVPLTPLEAWSDPHDGAERIYVTAPEGACDVHLRDGVIVVDLCE